MMGESSGRGANEETLSTNAKMKLLKTHLRKSMSECQSLRDDLARQAEALKRKEEQHQESLMKLQEKETEYKELADQRKQEHMASKDSSQAFLSLQQHVTKLEDRIKDLSRQKDDLEKEKLDMVNKFCELSEESEGQLERLNKELAAAVADKYALRDQNETLKVKCDSLSAFVREELGRRAEGKDPGELPAGVAKAVADGAADDADNKSVKKVAPIAAAESIFKPIDSFFWSLAARLPSKDNDKSSASKQSHGTNNPNKSEDSSAGSTSVDKAAQEVEAKSQDPASSVSTAMTAVDEASGEGTDGDTQNSSVQDRSADTVSLECKSLMDSLAAKEEEIQRLSADGSAMKADIEALSSQIAKLVADNQEKEARLAKLSEQLVGSSEVGSTVVPAQREEKIDSSSPQEPGSSEVEDELRQLRRDNAKQLEQREDLENELKCLQETIDSQRCELKELCEQKKAELEAAREKLEKVEQTLAGARRDKDDLRTTIARQHAELVRAKEEFESEALKLSAAQAHATELLGRCGILEREARKVGEDRDRLKEAIASAEEEVRQAKEKAAKAEELSERVQKEVQERADELEREAAVRKQRIEGELNQLRADLQQVKIHGDHYAEENAVLLDKQQQLENNKRQLEEQLASLTAEMKDMRDAVKGQEQMIQDLRREKHKQERTIVKLQQQNSDVERAQKEAEKSRIVLEEELGAMHTKLTAAESESQKQFEAITLMCENEYKLRTRLLALDPYFSTEAADTNTDGFEVIDTPASPARPSAGAPELDGAVAAGCSVAAKKASQRGKVIFSGLMEKRPFKFSLSSKWRQRLFFLYDDRLDFYQVHHNRSCVYRGSIPLQGMGPIRLRRGHYDTHYGIEIKQLSHNDKVYPLRCQNEESARLWYTSISEVLRPTSEQAAATASSTRPKSSSFSSVTTFSPLASEGSETLNPADFGKGRLFGGSIIEGVELTREMGPFPDQVMESDRQKSASLGLPLVVYQTVDFLQREGLDVEGLFRVPGRKTSIEQLRDYYEEGEYVTLSDVHDTAGLLKLYFRELPGALIPAEYAELIVKAAVEIAGTVEALKAKGTEEDRQQTFEHIRGLVLCMPPANLKVLRHLLGLLWAISQRYTTNKMTSANLAMVFAPTILPPTDHSAESMGMGTSDPNGGRALLNRMKDDITCIRILVDGFQTIFHGQTMG